MQQEIGRYITELLYKHDRLSIPGLGSLEMSHASAMLDQIQGEISAPSKAIKFNEHLIMDDGLLVKHLMEVKGWSLEECRSWVNEQVEQLKVALERREIVELAGLGRFFKNFEHQLQFVAENNNYNTDSFGLKEVTAQAVNHSIAERKTTTPLSTTPAVTAKIEEKETRKNTSSWLVKNLWWMILAAILLVSLTVFLLILQQRKQAKPEVNINVPKERLNTSPSKKQEEEIAGIVPNGTAEEEEIVDPVVEDEPEIDTEAATVLDESEHTAIIAVGLFKDPENVQALLEKLTKEGFSPVSQMEGSMTRVGVSILFEEESELEKILREVKRNYTKSAFVMYRDGVKVK